MKNRKRRDLELAKFDGADLGTRERESIERRIAWTVYPDDAALDIYYSDFLPELHSAIRAGEPQPRVKLTFDPDARNFGIYADRRDGAASRTIDFAKIEVVMAPLRPIELYVDDAINIVGWPAKAWDFVGSLRMWRSPLVLETLKHLPNVTALETNRASFKTWDRLDASRLTKLRVDDDQEEDRAKVEAFAKKNAHCQFKYSYRDPEGHPFAQHRIVEFENGVWTEGVDGGR